MSQQHSIVLYWHPMSSATPVACALAELGVPHQRVKVDIKAGEQHKPAYLALNPNGKVPTLTVDGAPMFEALAIQLWLLGAGYSMADLLVASVIGYSVFIGAPVAKHAHVQAWLGKVQARPAMSSE